MTELTKSEFVAEIQKRGEIVTTNIVASVGFGEWFLYETGVAYGESDMYSIYIGDLNSRNPPSRTEDIFFWDGNHDELKMIDKSWALSVIDKLPFEGIRKTVTFKSIPENAGVTCKSI